MDISDIVEGFKEAEQTREFAYERLMVDICDEVAKAITRGISKKEIAKRSACSIRHINRMISDDDGWVRPLDDIVHILHSIGLHLKVEADK